MPTCLSVRQFNATPPRHLKIRSKHSDSFRLHEVLSVGRRGDAPCGSRANVRHGWRRRSRVLDLCILFVVAIPLGATGASAQLQKPRVAVKTPAIGESVSKAAARHLNLSVLVQEMEASLLETRKFEVLTRSKEMLDQLLEEQEFSGSSFSKGNAAEAGQLEAANFLVFPTVQRFIFYRSITPVPNISSKYTRQDSGVLEINAQVIDTSSGQIKTTFYLKSSFATSKEVVNTKAGSPSRRHFTKMAKAVSGQMADQLVDTVFPMLVINVEGQNVYINRGQDGGLRKGDILNLYKPGTQLIDPYTNEVLGSAEEFIGEVKVVRVNPKFTIAETVAASLKGTPANGDILRKP